MVGSKKNIIQRFLFGEFRTGFQLEYSSGLVVVDSLQGHQSTAARGTIASLQHNLVHYRKAGKKAAQCTSSGQQQPRAIAKAGKATRRTALAQADILSSMQVWFGNPSDLAPGPSAH